MGNLKPCPFCSGAARFGYRGAKHMIYCSECGISTSDELANKDVVDAWNKRCNQPAANDDLMALCQKAAAEMFPRHEHSAGLSLAMNNDRRGMATKIIYDTFKGWEAK